MNKWIHENMLDKLLWNGWVDKGPDRKQAKTCKTQRAECHKNEYWYLAYLTKFPRRIILTCNLPCCIRETFVYLFSDDNWRPLAFGLFSGCPRSLTNIAFVKQNKRRVQWRLLEIFPLELISSTRKFAWDFFGRVTCCADSIFSSWIKNNTALFHCYHFCSRIYVLLELTGTLFAW